MCSYYSEKKMIKTAFDEPILNIAYSTLKDISCTANTVEHYRTACKLGFNALKGDVRPTLDGGLIMCHDVGFSLNQHGRIIKFDKNNCVQIAELSTEEILALEYEAYHEELGYYAHPCTFEQFVAICKEENMICYPTIRDNNMEVVVPTVLSVLDKYGMRNNTMINSMTLASLHTVREYDEDIRLCYTLGPGMQITKEHVDQVKALDNAVLDGYNFPFEDAYEKVEAAAEAICYAKKQGIRLFQAQIATYEQYCWAIEHGFTGFHILNSFLQKRR